ncbi:PAS domain S-box protein [Sutcliffiella horikoshii]|uniref:ATP-binding protein n=1 Tax=Sutcliffiella horikoshii TaxID=79883 RepID=UPI0020412D64|nr:ATP-binding protein [Sutcliffiella horikoshii]MCM3618552.1 PAS domain S-box protein [Sutcliffiella horikoshii]
MLNELLHKNPFENDDTVEKILSRLVKDLQEMLSKDSLVTTMIYDEVTRTLNPGPGYERFPELYVREIKNLPLGIGGCGIAAKEKRIVICEDMHSDEIWIPFLELTNIVGVRAVWSIPIYYREKIYGTFAIYHPRPYTPTEMDIRLSILMSKHAVTAFTFLQKQELESMYQLIFEHAKDIITISSPEGVVQYINPAVTDILGYNQSDVVGNDYTRFVNPEDIATLKAYKGENTYPQPALSKEFRGLTKEGHHVWLETVAKPVLDEYGHLNKIISTSRDISERRESEEALVNSEKLTAVGQLAAGVAHEIRNPLTSLKGFLQLIKAQGGVNPEYYEIMASELERIELISNEMLVLAKPQAKSMKNVDLVKLLKNVVFLLDSQALFLNIEVKLNVQRSLMLACVESEMKQVFINLLKNAFEAMPSGGVVTIRLMETAKSIIVEFKDQGVGISPEKIQELGKPFFTTKEKGTGLGLLVTNKIIKNHNGKLEYESELNEGTIARILLEKSKQKAMDVNHPTIATE